MDKSKQAQTALIRVAFQVPRPVRAALAKGAKETGVSLQRHVENQLTPLVPHLLCLWSGVPGREAA